MSVRKVVPIEKAEWHLAPAPLWVVSREPDWSFNVPGSHPVAFLLIDEQHHVASQTRTIRTVRKLLTLAAVQALGQVELDFDPAAHRLLIHELAVWRQQPDGTWDKRSLANRESFLLRQREQQLEQQMLNGYVSVVALLEDVRVGDALDLAWTLEPRDPLPGLRFVAFYVFGWTVPVARVFFTLHLADAETPNWRLHAPPDAPKPDEIVSPTEVTWSLSNPAIYEPEPNLPGSYWPLTMLDISGWSSWAEVVDFIEALWRDALTEGAEAIAAEAERIRTSTRDLSQAALEAIRFVQEEIRYLAVDFGHGGGMLPNGAATVLRRRFGDCKDKSVLLTALLRALGIEAWPMLIGAGWREAVARVQPSTAAFSHVIVTFTVEGRALFVDPTLLGQGGELSELIAPPYGCGLIIRPGATGLQTLPTLPLAEITLTETFNLDQRQKVGGVEQQLRATAWLADDVRSALLRQGTAAFFKARAETLQRHFPAATLRDETSRVSDDRPLNVIDLHTIYELPTWGPAGQKPPPMFTYGAHGLFLVIDVVEGPDQRRGPWALRHPLRVHHRVVVRGRCVQKTKPVRHRIEGPGFRYSCDVNAKGREVTFDYRWETTQRQIAPNEWAQYRQQRTVAFDRAGANVRTAQTPAWKNSFTIAAMIFFAAIVIGAIIDAEEKRKRNAAGPAIETSVLEQQMRETFEAAQRGDYAKAAPLIEKLLPHYPKNYQFETLRAQVLLETGKLTEARTAISAARGLQPKNATTDLLEAVLHEKMGDLDRARPLFEKAALRLSNNLPALFGLGRVAQLQGDDAAAREAWEKFLALQPANPDVLGRYAFLVWKSGERERADSFLLNFVKSQPVSGPVLESMLADYYTATGRPIEARLSASKAVELAPNDPDAGLRYVMALSRTGDTKGALDHARKMSRSQKHPLAWRALGIAAAKAGEQGEAEIAFSAWLQMAPHDPEAHSSYGYFLLQAGRLPEAKTVLEKAVREFPHWGPLWSNYALVLEALGDPGAAEAKRKAAKLTPAAEQATLLR